MYDFVQYRYVYTCMGISCTSYRCRECFHVNEFCICIYICICIYVCMYVSMYVCIDTYLYDVCMYTFIYIYMHTSIHIFAIHII